MNKSALAFCLLASLSVAGCSLNNLDTAESANLSSQETQSQTQTSDLGVPAKQGELRVAVFNAYLNRKNAGDILADVQSGDDTQIKKSGRDHPTRSPRGVITGGVRLCSRWQCSKSAN
ncbi:hypothetical protein [Pseudoalteromonas phenolica]|uniref:hypothetical protein n=1 Tax=Pseudoalteromonas phenolica TaxID=161398 RepID=UPI000FFE54EB|nr:hypothetical protein [Pseudoalteromonas phenolica]RXE95847.1 hypothetical protein D9981_14030 [Pseudoalteromonas phenolica O-BC30]